MLNISRKEKCLLVEVTEKNIHFNNIAYLNQRLDPLIEETELPMVIDLNRVQYIDSSGLGSLLKFRKSLKNKKMGLFLINLSKTVRTVFSLTRAEMYFHIHDNLESAMKEVESLTSQH